MPDTIFSLKGDERVMDALRHAALSRPSASDIFEQRVSFVYSSMSEKSAVTRDQVRQLVEAHDTGAQMTR